MGKLLKPILGSAHANLELIDGYANVVAGAITNSTSIPGLTGALTGTGEYTFTFVKSPQAVLFATCEWVCASRNPNFQASIKSYSTTSVVVNVVNASSPTALATPTLSGGLFLKLDVRRSSVDRT